MATNQLLKRNSFRDQRCRQSSQSAVEHVVSEEFWIFLFRQVIDWWAGIPPPRGVDRLLIRTGSLPEVFGCCWCNSAAADWCDGQPNVTRLDAADLTAVAAAVKINPGASLIGQQLAMSLTPGGVRPSSRWSITVNNAHQSSTARLSSPLLR